MVNRTNPIPTHTPPRSPWLLLVVALVTLVILFGTLGGLKIIFTSPTELSVVPLDEAPSTSLILSPPAVVIPPASATATTALVNPDANTNEPGPPGVPNQPREVGVPPTTQPSLNYGPEIPTTLPAVEFQPQPTPIGFIAPNLVYAGFSSCQAQGSAWRVNVEVRISGGNNYFLGGDYAGGVAWVSVETIDGVITSLNLYAYSTTDSQSQKLSMPGGLYYYCG